MTYMDFSLHVHRCFEAQLLQDSLTSLSNVFDLQFCTLVKVLNCLIPWHQNTVSCSSYSSLRLEVFIYRYLALQNYLLSSTVTQITIIHNRLLAFIEKMFPENSLVCLEVGQTPFYKKKRFSKQNNSQEIWLSLSAVVVPRTKEKKCSNMSSDFQMWWPLSHPLENNILSSLEECTLLHLNSHSLHYSVPNNLWRKNQSLFQLDRQELWHDGLGTTGILAEVPYPTEYGQEMGIIAEPQTKLLSHVEKTAAVKRSWSRHRQPAKENSYCNVTTWKNVLHSLCLKWDIDKCNLPTHLSYIWDLWQLGSLSGVSTSQTFSEKSKMV